MKMIDKNLLEDIFEAKKVVMSPKSVAERERQIIISHLLLMECQQREDEEEMYAKS